MSPNNSAKPLARADDLPIRQAMIRKGRVTPDIKIEKIDHLISAEEVNHLQQATVSKVAEIDEDAVFGADENGHVNRVNSNRLRKRNRKAAELTDDEYSPSVSTRSKIIKKEDSDAVERKRNAKSPNYGAPNNGRHVGRRLIRWTHHTKDLLLLCIQYQLTQSGIAMPYAEIAAQMFPEKNSSGQAIIQMLNKLRASRLENYAWVPPLPGRVADDHSKKSKIRGEVRIGEDVLPDRNSKKKEDMSTREIGWNEDCSMMIETQDIDEYRKRRRGPQLISGKPNRRPIFSKATENHDSQVDGDGEPGGDQIAKKKFDRKVAVQPTRKYGTRKAGIVSPKPKEQESEGSQYESEAGVDTDDDELTFIDDEHESIKKAKKIVIVRFNPYRLAEISDQFNMANCESAPYGYHIDKEDGAQYSEAVIGEHLDSETESDSNTENEDADGSDCEAIEQHEEDSEMQEIDHQEYQMGEDIADQYQTNLFGAVISSGMFSSDPIGGDMGVLPHNQFGHIDQSGQNPQFNHNSQFRPMVQFGFDDSNFGANDELHINNPDLAFDGPEEADIPNRMHADGQYYDEMINEHNQLVLKSDVELNHKGHVTILPETEERDGQTWYWYKNLSGDNDGYSRFRMTK